ncbi:DUF3223 domain-containing protein, partial [Vibrio anguillarum]|nr:DUF3223 domain-containing protein [Vibrio anguillarum]
MPTSVLITPSANSLIDSDMFCRTPLPYAIMTSAINRTYGVNMAKPVELANGTSFKTQTEAKKYFKSILNSSRPEKT